MKANELNSTEVRTHWDEAEVWLRRAVRGADPDSYLRNVQATLFAGINTLWRIEEEEKTIAYCVTNMYTVDGLNKIAQLHLMTAESLEEVIPLLDYFEIWAKKKGADWIEVIGRKGWERRLKPYGFNHEYTSLIKRVATEIH